MELIGREELKEKLDRGDDFGERRALGQLVESMNDFHWGKESKSEGWTNGQIAAHLTLGDGIPWRAGMSILFNGSINMGVEILQEKWAARGKEYVLERIKRELANHREMLSHLRTRWEIEKSEINRIREL